MKKVTKVGIKSTSNTSIHIRHWDGLEENGVVKLA